MTTTEVLKPQLGADGEPLGPIPLPGKIEEVIEAKAAAMRELVHAKPIPPDLMERLLAEMNSLREFLDPLIHDHVALLRSWGSSWEDIGRVLGVSRQSAWEKFRYVDGRLPRGVVDAPRK